MKHRRQLIWGFLNHEFFNNYDPFIKTLRKEIRLVEIMKKVRELQEGLN